MDRINLEAWVNICNLKDKLWSIDIAHFKGDITSMLHKIEDINSVILVEEDEYQDFILDIINALWIV